MKDGTTVVEEAGTMTPEMWERINPRKRTRWRLRAAIRLILRGLTVPPWEKP